MSSTSYKKQEGLLWLSGDQQFLIWTAKKSREGDSTLVLNVRSISTLQQTPASSSKVILKVFYTTDQGESMHHAFTFLSATRAREESNVVKSALNLAIRLAKTARSQQPWEADDDALLKDTETQQNVLKSDPVLQKYFNEYMMARSSGISSIQRVILFWSSRLQLLRDHISDKDQKRGLYNVLAEIKAEQEVAQSSGVALGITELHIESIFRLCPIVKYVHDLEAPVMKEQDFWSRFFQSRLFKRLAGSNLHSTDATDKVLDQYLDVELLQPSIKARSISRTIDLNGNENHHSQRQGNSPDLTMRLRSVEEHTLTLHRRINFLSESIMFRCSPAYPNLEMHRYDSTHLRDLEDSPPQRPPTQRIRNQGHLYPGTKDIDQCYELYGDAISNPGAILSHLCQELKGPFPRSRSFASSGMRASYSDNKEIDIDIISQATSHILSLLRQKCSHEEPIASQLNISSSLYERVQTTNATTTELVRQFWSALLAGHNQQASIDALPVLIKSLESSRGRINALMADAEREGGKMTARGVQMVDDNENSGFGGASVVERLLQPVTESISKALSQVQPSYAR